MMLNSLSIPRSLIDKFLRKITPLVAEVCSLFQANADQDGLTPHLKEWIGSYEVESWADAYEDFGNFLLVQYTPSSSIELTFTKAPVKPTYPTESDGQNSTELSDHRYLPTNSLVQKIIYTY